MVSEVLDAINRILSTYGYYSGYAWSLAMMTSAHLSFCWPEPNRRHRWVDAFSVSDNWTIGRRNERVLLTEGVDVAAVDFWEGMGYYEPLLKASGLFREFAEVETTEDGIRKFADRYGPLTIANLFVPRDVNAKFPKPRTTSSLAHYTKYPGSNEGKDAITCVNRWNELGAVCGDSFVFWTSNIKQIRFLVGLWDALVIGDERQIKRCVDVKNNGGHLYVDLVSDVDGKSYSMVYENAANTMSLPEAAEQGLINQLDELLSDSLSVRLQCDGSPRRGRLTLQPRTLKDAIWLQFALAVLGNKRYRMCDVCGRPFEVSPQVARTNRTLCSAACKARAHRQRREQAFKLAKQGLKTREIAKRVGSQLTTVQKWLSTQKKEK